MLFLSSLIQRQLPLKSIFPVPKIDNPIWINTYNRDQWAVFVIYQKASGSIVAIISPSDKILYQSNQGSESLSIWGHSTQVQSTVMETAGQECGAAGHITSTVRKQRYMNTRVSTFLLLVIQTETPDSGMVLTIRVSLPFLFSVLWKGPHQHAPKFVSSVFLKPVNSDSAQC